MYFLQYYQYVFCYIKMTLLYWNWFFLTVYRLENIQALLTIGKKSSVRHGVGVKALNMKYMYMYK
jgi:hypothetical protein